MFSSSVTWTRWLIHLPLVSERDKRWGRVCHSTRVYFLGGTNKTIAELRSKLDGCGSWCSVRTFKFRHGAQVLRSPPTHHNTGLEQSPGPQLSYSQPTINNTVEMMSPLSVPSDGLLTGREYWRRQNKMSDGFSHILMLALILIMAFTKKTPSLCPLVMRLWLPLFIWRYSIRQLKARRTLCQPKMRRTRSSDADARGRRLK